MAFTNYLFGMIALVVSLVLLAMFTVSVYLAKRRERNQAALKATASTDKDFSTVYFPTNVFASNMNSFQSSEHHPPLYDFFIQRDQNQRGKQLYNHPTTLTGETNLSSLQPNTIETVHPVSNNLPSLSADNDIDDGIEIIMNGSKAITDEDRATSSPTITSTGDNSLFNYDNIVSSPGKNYSTRRRSSSLDDVNVYSLRQQEQRSPPASDNSRIDNSMLSMTSIHSVELISDDHSPASNPSIEQIGYNKFSNNNNCDDLIQNKESQHKRAHRKSLSDSEATAVLTKERTFQLFANENLSAMATSLLDQRQVHSEESSEESMKSF